MPTPALGRTDRRILEILQCEGRLSNLELAGRVNLSPSACLRRVRALEEAGVIRGYVALLDPARVGLGLLAFVTVKLEKRGRMPPDAFARAVRDWPEVVGCHSMTGEMDYLLRVHVEAPLPQPNSIDYYGPLTTADPARSYIFNFLGKFTVGKVQIRVQAPYIQHHAPMGFPGFVTRQSLAEDSRCPYADTPTDPTCLDQGRRARDNNFNFLDRYVVAEFRNRFADGRAGIKLQAYGVQFQRNFDHLGILAPIPGLLEGGLSFSFDATSYRTGGAIEGDYELPGNRRLQYGGEAFREFALNDVTRSRQGEGIEATFIGPYNLDRLPLPCPRELDPDNPGATRPIANCPLTFSFPTRRSVLGG